jgi:predicted small lipoprotein YifL
MRRLILTLATLAALAALAGYHYAGGLLRV